MHITKPSSTGCFATVELSTLRSFCGIASLLLPQKPLHCVRPLLVALCEGVHTTINCIVCKNKLRLHQRLIIIFGPIKCGSCSRKLLIDNSKYYNSTFLILALLIPIILDLDLFESIGFTLLIIFAPLPVLSLYCKLVVAEPVAKIETRRNLNTSKVYNSPHNSSFNLAHILTSILALLVALTFISALIAKAIAT